MFNKLGYDLMLHSLKSRVFVITFQADDELTVKINDILDGDMNKTASNILMEHLMEENQEDIEEDDSNEDVKIIKYLNG